MAMEGTITPDLITDLKELLVLLLCFSSLTFAVLVFVVILHFRTRYRVKTTLRLLSRIVKNQVSHSDGLGHAMEVQKRSQTILDAILAKTMDIASVSRLYEYQVTSNSTSNANNAVTVNTSKDPGDYQEALLGTLGEERRQLIKELDAKAREAENMKRLNQEIMDEVRMLRGLKRSNAN
jgi:hypothetical protein